MQANPINHEKGPLDEAAAWFQAIPVVTRAIFGGTMAVSIVSGAGFITPYTLVLDWRSIWYKREVWRLVTPFFFHPLNFGFLTILYFIYTYSAQLETSPQFAARKSDYFFFVLFSSLLIFPLGVYMGLPVLIESLLLSMIYTWAMNNQETQVSFFFGLRFKALYLPWVYIMFDFLSGMPFPPVGKLIGIFAGHVYYFLDILYPEYNGGFKPLEYIMTAFSSLFGEAEANSTGGYRLGTGNSGGWFLFGNRAAAAPAPALRPASASRLVNPASKDVPRASGNASTDASDAARKRTGYDWGGSGKKLGSE